MGEMRDSDWSREKILRSDWLSPSVATITTNGPKQLNENYNNQQKDYQIKGYLDQIRQRKLKIPDSFLSSLIYQTWWNFRSSIEFVIPSCR